MDFISVGIGMSGLGFLFLIFIVFGVMISKSYVKAPANKSFVRTGGLFGGAEAEPLVIKDGGAWVFGVMHEIRWVDLRTMSIEVERIGENALLTTDPQYADIRAIFYIKVNPTKEGIISASRTIGGEEVESNVVKELVEAKLDGALRDVAASFKLMDLHSQREKFIQDVRSRLKEDLEENGLALEGVSILTLKAAEQGSFSTNDVFGAKVARANAEVIEEARRKQNEIERDAETSIQERNEKARQEQNQIDQNSKLEVKRQNDEAAEKKLELDKALALAQSEQAREIRTQQARDKAEADKAVYEQEEAVRTEQADKKAEADKAIYAQQQAVEAARLAKERAIEEEEIRKEQALKVQIEEKQQAIETAEIERLKAMEVAQKATEVAVLEKQKEYEVAQKAKEVAVLEKQKEFEEAERARLEIVAQREEAAQKVKTVEELAEAERDAQRIMINRKNEVELHAFKRVEDAKAEASALKEMAQAEKEASIMQAETKRTEAQAKADSEKLAAEAERARASASGLAEAEVIEAKSKARLIEADVVKAAGLAEAEVIKAKADADKAEADVISAKGLAEAETIKAKGLAEAEAVKAKGLAEAEGEMAKADALAAHDNVQQMLEIERLRLEAQIKIGVARAQAMGSAMAEMEIKMFGTPEAADNILRLMSYADGANEILETIPEPLKDAGNQLLTKVTGSNSNGQNHQSMTLEEVNLLLPQILNVVSRTLDMSQLSDLTVADVIKQLEALASKDDQPIVQQAKEALVALPFLGSQTVESLLKNMNA